MRLGYDLTIEQSQKLMMTPELIQAIQILQFNTFELEEFVQKELVDNPILELDSALNLTNIDVKVDVKEDAYATGEGEESFVEKIKENDTKLDDISYRQWEYQSTDDELKSFEEYTTKEETLLDELLFQLSISELVGNDRKIGRFIIEAIDDNGYLTIGSEEISILFNVSIEKVEDILDVIQTFEPSGVGARNLEECLCIQLREKNLLEDAVLFVILHHLKDIADNRIGYISKETGLSIKEVQMIADLIKSLEPKPGRSYASKSETRYIVPDVYVDKIGEDYQIICNDEIVPNLFISKYYVNMLNSNPEDKELNTYLNDKFNQANWLIKSIEQRKKTIYNVCNSILERQKEFLINGPKFLKTLTLKEVAEDVGVHESTVSRTINGKYMQTPRGVFEFKYFFSSGVSDSNGEGMSSNSVKEYIKEIVDSEDPKVPYSDQQMVEILSNKGIEISRRTVAKYRESMNILSSSRRRRF